MRICFDHQIFSTQNYGGISRYFAEMLKDFHADPAMEVSLPLWLSDNHYIERQPFARHRGVLGGRKFKGRLRVLERINRMASGIALRRGRYDIFHPTYYHPYFLDRLGSRPFVLTVYDMIHEIFPDLYPASDPIREYKRALIPRAARILAISEHTKRDILRFFDVPPERIVVTHLANSLRVPPPGEAPPADLPSRYLLFVGNRGAYKNFSALARAVAPLMEKDRDLHILCTGGGPFGTAEQAEFASLGIAHRVLLRSADDRALFHLYRNARVHVFPSRYEGFGIPVLESFAASCPMALSRSSSLPEIAGDAARYFDPDDPDSIREAVDVLLRDEEARRDLVAKGHARLGQFTWSETARQTKAVYRSLA